MANVIDYLKWRGDIGFAGDAPNEVDALIFSALAYVDYEGIVGDALEEGGIALAAAAERYAAQDGGKKRAETITAFARRIPDLQAAAAGTRRYGDVTLSGYVAETDRESAKQFAGVTFSMGEVGHFIAFRGTDATINGWKEDLHMSFMTEVPAQQRAGQYLEVAASQLKGRFWLGGHSKGGNLAVFAATQAPLRVQDRVVGVCSNDGPGFQPAVIASDGYQRVMDRLNVLIPRSSVVGLMLEHSVDHIVVSSRELGPLQHDPFTWEVLGPSFVRAAGLSKHSLNLRSVLQGWLGQRSLEERAAFVDALFDVIEATGARTVADLNKEKLAAAYSAIKAYRNLDPTAQAHLAKTVEVLFVEGQRTLRDSLRADIAALMTRLRSLNPF